MHSTNTTSRRQLLKWRPIHGVMIALALIAPLVLTAWLGGAEALQRVKHFPLGLLLLMLVMAFLCWNLNAARLRLMLGGRAGRLGQRGALGIELASKFALCATPGGSGGPATLLLLLARRGFPPAKGAAVFLIDQGCDLLFFLAMLSGLVLFSVFSDAQWPHQSLVQWALVGLAFMATLVSVVMRYLPSLLRSPSVNTPWPSQYQRRWLARRLLRCRHALKVTLELPRTTLLAMMLLTTAHWLMRYSLLYLAVLGVGGHADWIWTFLTQMLAMAASQLSFLPGGAGAAEVGVGGLLLPLMEREQAAAAVLVWRLVSYHLYLAAGAPLFVLYSYRMLRRSPTP
ncbi:MULTISPECIES: lysylphosphatidylglycerol synthase transmembrane domain-containing protein [Halomonadaceae]|uniref:lysylphosphatidylglycerol synthase transmembrane domain-containing protein n=1 Tax=Halomonadaceae TaxID=28256 RepID=UPI000C32C662|nr:lysylphosphatidylglycerol synthase transmembrane domain-containing protein [Halomonas sp. MES3-P3E]PKG53822.1 TIGR00374 family protein [Halomonas sp. MES3-P3E]